MKIGGMSCQGCVASVTQVLKAIDGVRDVDVSLEEGRARVHFDAGRTNPAALRHAVEDAGYDAQ